MTAAQRNTQRWRSLAGAASCELRTRKAAWLVLLVSVLLAGCSAQLELLARALEREVSALAQPVTGVLVDLASTLCEPIRRLSGASFDQRVDEVQPDLNRLTLQFTDPEVSVVYNLTAAARLIPRARRFQPGRKLFILVHGHGGDASGMTISDIRDALFSQGNGNVLALDATSLTESTYLLSSTHARFIGGRLGEVLAAMVGNGVDPSLIHLIGTSLGAQIVSLTGKSFTSRTGALVGRVTGLDPVGFCFMGGAPDMRVAPGDGAFVDVIHTDYAVYGYASPSGHVDYYPNGGMLQPGCRDNGCGHGRAVAYFVESITRPRAFLARRCRNWNAFRGNRCDDHVSPMGYASEPGTIGLYFLQTGAESPYGLGEQGLTWRNDDGLIENTLSFVSDLVPGLLPGLLPG